MKTHYSILDDIHTTCYQPTSYLRATQPLPALRTPCTQVFHDPNTELPITKPRDPDRIRDTRMTKVPPVPRSLFHIDLDTEGRRQPLFFNRAMAQVPVMQSFLGRVHFAD